MTIVWSKIPKSRLCFCINLLQHHVENPPETFENQTEFAPVVSTGLITFIFLLTLQLSGQQLEWRPRPSLEDSWRWNKLSFLDKYRILTAAKGNAGDVWFAHKIGLIRYDGHQIEEFPFNQDIVTRIQDLFVSSVYLLSQKRMIASTRRMTFSLAALAR